MFENKLGKFKKECSVVFAKKCTIKNKLLKH